MVLLYSGTQENYSGRYSILAHRHKRTIESSDFEALQASCSHNRAQWENAWFGYLGYGLKDSIENYCADTIYPNSVPKLCMMQFKTILVFDHKELHIDIYSEDDELALELYANGATQPPDYTPIQVYNASSNMSASDYREKVQYIIDAIAAGTLYQANLTRKFWAELTQDINEYELFCKLCDISPAPYSAFIKTGQATILSSSPELFLKLDAKGNIISRPIKGTTTRYKDSTDDASSRCALSQSAKDKSENLMIVDLMRNDLSKCATPGSVKVSSLFEITSHSNVHHMSSTISAKKTIDVNVIDVIRHAFPPGSMTGAPKIKAIEICSQLEELERGIYSGAIGWIGGDGSAELSVVIRTLLIVGKRLEFQVGGGIVFDSTPEGELQETMHKAAGLLQLLNYPTTVFTD